MATIFFTIQLMKFYLHTAYGDLASFYGGGRTLLTPLPRCMSREWGWTNYVVALSLFDKHDLPAQLP